MIISTPQLRLIFSIFYIGIDILYVNTAKNIYNESVIKIQKEPMPDYSKNIDRLLSAVAAWSCMIIGWAFLAAPMAEKWTDGNYFFSPFIAGAAVGLIYGLLLIGTYNFTLHAMFINYDKIIMFKDLSWGISWSIIITSLYAYVYYKSKNMKSII